MGFHPENFKRIRAEYENKYLIAEEAADRRLAEVHARLPEVAALDKELGETGFRILEASMSGGDLAAVRERTEALREKRAALLLAAGYPATYTDPVYECEKCHDAGYIGYRMCSCMRDRLVAAGYESSGIARLMKTQTFETFDLSYYREDQDALERMKIVYEVLRDYAETFSVGGDTPSPSLTLVGGTGLGKTHLSTALAKRVIERGFDVCYIGAVELFDELGDQRFRKSTEERTERFYSADLLILDDLGTEMTNQFTVSCLYQLLNIRINRALPTIVSTNLGGKDLQARYSDRIASRLFGEFRPLLFAGTDVRKLRRMKNPW